MDFSTVTYSNVALSYIGVTPGMNGNQVLAAINVAVNSVSGQPDYSGYSLGCVRTQVGTIDTTQQFAEGISGLFCTLQSDYTTFTGTTYPAAQTVLGAAITALQVPGVTYTPFSITDTMNVTQTWNALFTGLSGLGANTTTSTFDSYSANWSTLSITPSHSTITTWNNVIAYLSSMASTVAGKQDQIATFDNTGNCLVGGATDSIFTTVGELIAYTCALPVYVSGAITWGCISAGGDLQDDIQAIANSISGIQTNYVTAAGDSSLTYAEIGSCSGYSLAINAAWNGLYKVMANGSDGSPNFLADKFESSDSSIDITVSPNNNQINLSVATPVTNEVLVNAGDVTPGYLVDKLPSTAGTWGLANVMTVASDNASLAIAPTLIDPDAFLLSMFAYVSSDPDLLAAWCALNNQCNGCACSSPTALTVSLTEGGYSLGWTPSGAALTQTVQYRQRGNANWNSNVNITAPNPQITATDSATVTGLAVNTVYQFQVVSNCSGVSNGSNVYESITFYCQTPTISVNCTDGGAIISINQTPLPTVDSITYQLINSDSVVVDTEIATGLSPNVNFTPQPNDTYTITWFYGATINGVTLYSTDPSQINEACSYSDIVVSC